MPYAGHEVATEGPLGFADFVRTRYTALVRSACLLIGDRGHAEDVVQSALVKTLGVWDRLTAPEAAEAYTRTTMVRLIGRWSRRRWRGEMPGAELLDESADLGRDLAVAMDVQAALSALPWRQRAVLVQRARHGGAPGLQHGHGEEPHQPSPGRFAGVRIHPDRTGRGAR